MKLSEESKRKLASCLATELRSWFSKEDLDKIIKTFEAISSTEFKEFRTYNFALFLVNRYEVYFKTEQGYFKTEQGLLNYVKSDLNDLLRTIRYNLVISEMLSNK